MINAKGACAGLLLITALGTPARADELGAILPRNGELQKRSEAYPVIPLALSREGMKFQRVILNTNGVDDRGAGFDGVRFNTGSATGTFYWAFTWSPRIDRWYIIPATGSMEQGFTRWDAGILTNALGGVAKRGAEIYFQTLPPDLLQRDTTYVIWYSFRDAAPCEFDVSAALIGGAPIPSRQRYPMRKPEPAELREAEVGTIEEIPAEMAVRQPFAGVLAEAVDPQFFAAIKSRTAAKGFASTVDAGIRAEIPPAGALLAGFKFGLGGFAGTTIIKCIQPLFLTSEGLTPGGVYGQGDLDRAVLAPPGYAVGAMRIRTGDRVDGLNLRFMKILPGKLALDPDDALQSDWVGGNGGSIHQMGGSGRPVIGVAIKSGADVDNLGIALLL